MKRSVPDSKRAAAYALAGLREGAVQVPYVLLKSYKSLKLNEQDAMLLIHLIAFVEKDRLEFPTIEQLQSRMSAAPETVIVSLQKLLKLGLLSIDERTEEATGILYERYNFDPLYEKLAEVVVSELQTAETETAASGGDHAEKDLFTVFENEFARPLTPMELETISAWLDKDKYKEELILTALKEAVFSGKLHFRYIDRILLEWSRNRVQTTEQAKEYAQRFRGGSGGR